MSDHQASTGTKTLTSVAGLVDAGLVQGDRAVLEKVAQEFRVAITPDLSRLADPAAPADPIRAQFVPSPDELETHDWETGDPIGDEVHEVVKGVTHRYPDRVLLKPTHTCRVYCRFCFRREKVGDAGEQLTEDELDQALAYIRSHPEVWEVILSGGDPLVLSDRRLARVMAALDAIEHVKVIRLHTRVPVADPARVTGGLLAALGVKTAVYVVVHCNHAKELSTPVRGAIARLVDAGIPVLSQSVLLKGVNDSPEALRDLTRALVETRVKPYYLHHPDLARGTGHFRVSIRRGLALMRALRGVVSGLCQPTYVLDIPGGFGKVPLTPQALRETGAGRYEVRDFRGTTHAYADPIDPLQTIASIDDTSL
ncbi:lysine 2,3-aminomutase [Defluviimonas sp. 20V17]|uniref:Lysine 2,3-aminomutase n=1 Tax=Allgaiera indica TaxID=765699 RepID=A0AAN4UU80_9RHOB|nr:lysine-2,3-aminomutase-like protein [Allgaiera indica]KDB01696.1 lysine 2,3-aminomutase [Defluviimonas sp. 20V17]GHE04006.1 lysine 2,3-aminomutase [Allgaiera indica]SDX34354.1 L-lysine 2,3-aminomutase [Allgaiera indica]